MVFKYRGAGAAGEGSGGPKLDAGWMVPKNLTDSWDYFDLISGTLAQVGGGASVALTQKPKGSVYPFQVGKGANGKTWAYSSSGWLDWVKTDGTSSLQGHGDINVDLDLQPLPAACDVCSSGSCQAGLPNSCDDANPCTDDACVKGQCSHKDTNGKPCEDGKACTPGDKCFQGECKPGDAKHEMCEDNNPCTKDLCNPGQGCLHAAAPKGTACDDGDACSVGEACLGNQCKSGETANCADNNPCTTEACDPKKGCTFAPATSGCDDDNACISADQCQGGVCQGGSATLCNDNNTCTDDSCDPAKGCVYAPLNGIACTDGNACTLEDTCIKGKCKIGGVDPCDDGKPCTQDSCDWQTGCLHLPMNGNVCDDGDKCSSGDLCAKGQCLPGTAVDCDDHNACTKDGCFSAIGCKNEPLNAIPCDDGDKCKGGETCQSGTCTGGSPVNCNDANPCTADVCDALLGCQHKMLDGKFCDDGNSCTQGDSCVAGKCVSGQGKTCDDGNPCTVDSCTAAKGCSYSAADGKGCDDGDTCSVADKCQAGACQGSDSLKCADGNLCTNDFSDPKSGCTFPPNDGMACDDGDVCSGDSMCKGGKCAGFKPVSCDDQQPCTVDSCDKAKGCLHTAQVGTCSDGDACTAGDSCQDGNCAAGLQVDCGDGNPCSADSCDPVSGCSHKALSGVTGSLALVSDGQTTVGGAPAVATWNGHPSWTASIPGATWIWSSAEVVNPTVDTTAVLTRSFGIPAGASNLTGSLVISADNSYSCTLNGKPVGADATEFNYFESSKDTWTLGGALETGSCIST